MNNKGSNANANANGSDSGSVNAFKVNQTARSWAWIEEWSRGEGAEREGVAWGQGKGEQDTNCSASFLFI